MAVQIRRLFYRGTGGSGGVEDAIDVGYDNSTSGLAATNVQDAIDEIVDLLPGHTTSFIVANWVGPTVDNTYTITVPFSTHKKENPVVRAYEESGSDFVEVEVSVLLEPSNNLTISVPSTPDLRFNGKFIVK